MADEDLDMDAEADGLTPGLELAKKANQRGLESVQQVQSLIKKLMYTSQSAKKVLSKLNILIV